MDADDPRAALAALLVGRQQQYEDAGFPEHIRPMLWLGSAGANSHGC
jgi:hypothetical protein